jgi:aspartate aminotransferase-like enzyme
VMQAYAKGGHMYHATLPTDAITQFEARVKEYRELGLGKLEMAQWELGTRTAKLLEAHGVQLVAAEGFRSPSVVVGYTSRDDVQNGSAFKARGMQIAGGVPLFVSEGPEFKSFRLGMLGLDKLADVDATIAMLDAVLRDVGSV